LSGFFSPKTTSWMSFPRQPCCRTARSVHRT
jgi:hypothetical protein